MIKFNGKILIIGCGAVAQCSLPLIFDNIEIPPENITFIDRIDNRKFISSFLEKGVIFELKQITRTNYIQFLSNYLKPGDICIDLANQVDTNDILDWCFLNQIMYLNTSLNSWPHDSKDSSTYNIYQSILDFINLYDKKGPTAVISHGANPGLVSSFAKQAIIDISKKIIEQNSNPQLIKEIENAISDNDFAKLAYLQNTKVIHISEIDSQISSKQKKINEFLNTWSIIEFINECTNNVEFSWGTHEKTIPTNAMVINNNIFFKQKALDFQLKSWVPCQEFNGIIPPHDESFSLADFLTIKEDNKIIYRPTIVFAYKPCPQSMQSLIELKNNNYSVQKNQRIIKNEIIKGMEKMGCLVMGHQFNSWWTGSILSIEESNKLEPNQNATIMQVAAGIIAALVFMIKNPKKGICFPEQLNHEDVLKISKPYLGNFISDISEWNTNEECQLKNFWVNES